jgi:outer membrane lipoprotein SlyB
MKKAFLLSVLLLAGCASAPSGPGVLVLPGSSKSFDQFRADESDCRQYAGAQPGGTTPTGAGVASAAVGTAIGAVAGAAIGGQQGAAVGAGIGLAGGALAGAGNAQVAGRSAQQRYDFGYQQCMYAKGHKVPVAGRYDNSRQVARRAAPPPPPPPPGTPPGMPPDYRVN